MTDPELIYSAITGDPTLGDLIGDRIYPVVLPPTQTDKTTGAVISPLLPAVTYMLVSQATDFAQTNEQYRWPRWRFRIYSLRYRDLVPVATALAAVFGDQAQTPFPRSWIEYPASAAEGHEDITHRYWRAMDVIAFSAAGAQSQ